MSEVEKWKLETNIVDKTGAVEVDDMIYQAAKVVLSSGDASTGSLQQKLGIGYCQAAQVLDGLEKLGIVGPFEGTRPRKILVTMQEYESRTLWEAESKKEINVL